ncbi:MAG: formate dehydrogenase accessory sulfurtransferase FdhD [Rhodanobacter sp.]
MTRLPSDLPEPAPGYVRRRVERWREAGSATRDDLIAEEMPVAIRCNGEPFAVMMITPHELEDFALGFSLSEGLIDNPGQLLAIESHLLLEGIELALTVTADAPANRRDTTRERWLPGRSGCGICGARELEQAVRQPRRVERNLRFSHAAIEHALTALPPHQLMNTATGAVHAAAWADAQGQVVLVREDVGRHNALDKLIGAMHHSGIGAEQGFALITSRASYEMVMKAASAGIGMLVAISAPTALAIELARSTDLTLIGFARSGSHNVYSHPQWVCQDAELGQS